MKKLSFPTAHTILLIIAGIVALLTFLIPAGQFESLAYNKEKNVFIHNTLVGSVDLPANQETLDQFGIKSELAKFTNGDIYKPVGISGTYKIIESSPQGFLAWLQSPLKGIKESIDVILFVLILGGCIGIVQASGAFDAGVAWLAQRLKGREKLLIIIITSLVALGGTTFGLAEETIAFYPILVPVFLAAGYDAIVALAAIYIGSSIGTMVSTVNPFSTIIASNAAGINWTSGLNGRIMMLVLGVGICLWYIIRYAERVRKDPSQSLIYAQKEAIERVFLSNKNANETAFTSSIRGILMVFLLCFMVMIWGVSSQGWWFLEMTTVFFTGAVVIGLFSHLGEKSFVSNFIKGSNDLLSVALIIGIARGVSVLMDDGHISDTLLHWASGLVDGMPKTMFISVMMFLFAGLSFFIPSSSGMAVLSMPIMAPLADVVGVPRESVVDAYQYGMGLMAFITPTGLILPSLTMVDITFDKWIKFVLPLLGILTLVSLCMLWFGVYV